jgi:hypothetical protein
MLVSFVFTVLMQVQPQISPQDIYHKSYVYADNQITTIVCGILTIFVNSMQYIFV